MNVNQVIKALKTTVQYASNLYGAQPLILSSAAKLLEDCMPYLKSDSTPAQALAQMHGDMDGLLGLLAKEKRNAEQAAARILELEAELAGYKKAAEEATAK